MEKLTLKYGKTNSKMGRAFRNFQIKLLTPFSQVNTNFNNFQVTNFGSVLLNVLSRETVSRYSLKSWKEKNCSQICEIVKIV